MRISRANLFLLFASVLAGVALVEIAVRIFRVDYTLTPNWRYHPVLGWSQVPGGTYDGIVDGRPVHVSFNSIGFRDSEHQRAKPPGVKRIVVIGDSFCEAVQVNLEQTFQRQLQDLLNAGGSTRWEVINLGVGDFGTAQEYIALQRYGLAFDPDVVVHEIFPFNDICNNSLGLYGLCRSNNDRYRPYFVKSGGKLRQTYAQPVRDWLRRHVVTYHVLEYWFMKVQGPDPQNPEDPGRPFRLWWHGYRGLDPLLYTFVSAKQQPREVAEGWWITEALIERIVRTTRERNIDYVGVVAPFEISLQPANWDKIARLLPPPPLVRDYPEQRLSALFTRLGVASVMLLNDFEPYASEVLPFLGGHLNVAGHRRAAEALYQKLVGSGIAAR